MKLTQILTVAAISLTMVSMADAVTDVKRGGNDNVVALGFAN